MSELSSRTALGGIANVSTHLGFIIHKVFADGVYGWKEKPADIMAAVVADMASRPAEADVAEGFEAYVQTNRLTFVVRNGAYAPKAIQVTVADDADRDSLTEMIDKQRAYISDQDSIDTYDLASTSWKQGIATITFDNYDDITSPADYTVGDKLIVTNDADESLRGEYDVLGAAIGMPGAYIEKV